MKLIGAGSIYARANRFMGYAYGANSHIEFNAESKDFIGMAETVEILDKMQHQDIKFNPSNAGLALNNTINDLVSHKVSLQYILLMVGRNSMDDLESAMRYAQKMNVKVFTFFIGGIKFPKGKYLSTDVNGKIPVRRLYDLLTLEYELLELFCDVAEPHEETKFVPQPTIPAPRMPCKVDLVLAVDDLFFQKPRNLASLKNFIKKFSSLVSFGQDQTRVSVIKFGGRASNLYRGFQGDRDALKSHVNQFKLSTASKGLSYQVAAERAIRIFDKFGRSGSDVKRLLAFVTIRRGKVLLQKPSLRKLHDNKVLFTSVVTENSATLSDDQLTNFGYKIKYKK